MFERIGHAMIHPLIVSISFGGLFATGVVLDEKTIVPIGTLGCVGALLWWLATKLQKIDDRLEAIEKLDKSESEKECPVCESRAEEREKPKRLKMV